MLCVSVSGKPVQQERNTCLPTENHVVFASVENANQKIGFLYVLITYNKALRKTVAIAYGPQK